MYTYYFNTKIGRCGITWNDEGIERVVMCPRKTKGATDKPPKYIKDAAKRITDHLAGKIDDLRDIEVDLSNFTPFTRKVYLALRRVQPGEVITYGELARMAGSPRAARAVGHAMATNPLPLIIPCHRVIASNGSLGGFSAPDGIRLKDQLLRIERSFQRR